MNVHWTHNATHHLVDIYDFISKDSKYYARRMVDRITKRSEQIAFEPLSGRIVPEYQDSNVREIFEGPYRIIYLVLKRRIDVLAVIHGARLLPDGIA
jgi:plasmid stabilization system protein ParE